MRQVTRVTALLAGVLVAAAGCGSSSGGSDNGGSSGAKPLAGVKLQVAAKWTGAEQKNFMKVVSAFEDKTGAKVTYAATGENIDAWLGPRIQGKNPPDIAVLPQPGLMKQYAAKGALKPLPSDVTGQLDAHYAPAWKQIGEYKGTSYGLVVKTAQKSLVWYSTKDFSDAGVQPPKTWADLMKVAGTLSDSGHTPFSVGAKDGWPLTDWFENVYLSQAGPGNYDKLAEHKIPWTDASVNKALKTLAQVWGKSNWLAGGTKGELQASFVDSVTQAFGQHKAAMVPEADFAATNIAQTKAKVGVDAKTFAFPAAGSTPPQVVGGDIAVMLKAGKGAKALLKYLASPEAGSIWAKPGGYLSPNKDVPMSAYPDALTKSFAKQIIDAGNNIRYDMSDQMPSAFGGTPGAGEWKDLQDFFAHPDDVKGAQKQLEADAKKAYKS